MLAAAAAGGGAVLWVRHDARWLAVAVVSLSCCMPVPLYLALSLSPPCFAVRFIAASMARK